MMSGALVGRLLAFAEKMRAESEEWGRLDVADKWADELTAIAISEHAEVTKAEVMVALEIVFRAGFQAGFDVSREGFNGDCENDHRAPKPFNDADDPLQAAEDAAFGALILGLHLVAVAAEKDE